MSKRSRREFLKLSALGLASTVLAACGVKETATPTLAPTAMPPTVAATANNANNNAKGKIATPAPKVASDAKLIASPMLGRPTDKSITLNVVLAAALPVYYEYGTASGAYPLRTPAQTTVAATPLETTITDLQPNTRYYYRLHYGDAVGQEASFVTQRPAGKSFMFAIQGDSHPERLGKQFDPVLYQRTLASVAASQPDFYMTIGDDFSVDNLKTINADTVAQLYLNQRQFLGGVGSVAPIFLLNGNHEQAAQANLNGTPNNVAVYAQKARNSYYPQPAPDAFYTGDAEPIEHIGLLRDYYAWTWGEAHFIVLDNYWHSVVPADNVFGGGTKTRDLWNIGLGETQYKWFEQTLKQSKAKYKFVFAHHVHGTGRGGVELAKLYEWGGYDRNGAQAFAQYRPGWSAPIHKLMVDNKVNIFFQGHDHIFVRQQLDGVIYQTLPVPADPNYSLFNEDAYQSGDKLPNSGHLRVTVAPENVKVDYVRSYLNKPDEVAFTYTVK